MRWRFQNEVGWWRRSRGILRGPNSRELAYMTKTGAIPGYTKGRTLSSSMLHRKPFYYCCDSIRWRHFDSGVLFEVGGSCWLAVTTGPGVQTVYPPWHCLACRVISLYRAHYDFGFKDPTALRFTIPLTLFSI